MQLTKLVRTVVKKTLNMIKTEKNRIKSPVIISVQ